MKLNEITDDYSFMAFLFSIYLGRLATDGIKDDYYSLELSNDFFHSDVRVTIKKVPSPEDKMALAELLGVDIDEQLKHFRKLQSMETSTKYENWHYQIYHAKSRLDKDIQKYENEIRKFFDGKVLVHFYTSHDTLRISNKEEGPIPNEKLIEFQNTFGYMLSYVDDSVEHAQYRFVKKTNNKYGHYVPEEFCKYEMYRM